MALYVDDVCPFTDTDAAAEEFDQLTPSADQFADGLTKPLPADIFKRHRAAQLGRAPATFDDTTPNEACKKTIDFPLYSKSNVQTPTHDRPSTNSRPKMFEISMRRAHARHIDEHPTKKFENSMRRTHTSIRRT